MSETLFVLWHYLKARYGYKFRNRGELEVYQARQLVAFQKAVLPLSPFYRKYEGQPLSAYPIMNKKLMMAQFDTINTRQVKREEAMSLAQHAENTRDFSAQLGDVTVGLSSGTSGTRGLFAVSRAEQSRWAGTILAKVLHGSLLRKHRIAFFLRADSKLYQAAHHRGRVDIHFFDLACPFEGLLRALQEFQPFYLVAPAQTLRLLAEAQRAQKIKLFPKKLISVAEVLDPFDEAFIEDTFKLGVHQIYQCTEGFLAASCAEGRLHLNEEFVHFEQEWVDEAAGRFIPILTDFSRTTQPIVRYRLDDILLLDKDPCPCGSPCTVITKVEGRSDDILYGRHEGSTLVPLFPDLLRHTAVRASKHVRDYKLVQGSPTSIDLSVDTDSEEGWSQLANAIQGVFASHGCEIPQIERSVFVAASLKDKKRHIVRTFPIERSA